MNDTPQVKIPWYIQHRMRALLLMMACAAVVGGVAFAAVFITTVNRLKTTVPYQMALETVVQHRGVQSQLGRPVEAAWRAAGQVNEATGYTELTLIVTGPTGKGTVRAIAERDPEDSASEWQLVFLDVSTFSDFGVQTFEIIGDKPPTGVTLPEPTPEAKEKYGID